MALPISIGEVLEIASLCKKVYDKVKNCSDKIDAAGKSIAEMTSYLGHLKALLTDNNIAVLRPSQVQEMETMAANMKKDMKEVKSMLEDYHKKVVGRNVELPFDLLNKMYFVTARAKKMDALLVEMKEKQAEINRWINILNGFTSAENVKLSKELLHQLEKLRLSLNVPPQSPPKKEVSILFVDYNNTGRSKIGEAYAKLVKQWTTSTGGHWAIRNIHSAGSNLRSRGDVISYVETMEGEHIIPGGQSPDRLAMAALFDNKLFNKPYKATIKDEIYASKSRGLTKALFNNYDYIFIFTRRMDSLLVRLRLALVEAQGSSAVAKGKGKIMLLGEYGNKRQTQIFNPIYLEAKDEAQKLENWKKVVSLIKISFKSFLKEELNWKQPDPDFELKKSS